MALISRPLNVGSIRGAVYTLEHAGDVFPVHVHQDSDVHITIVAHGRIRCTGRHEIEGKILEASAGGTVVDWNAGEPHGFIAETDGATLINIVKASP